MIKSELLEKIKDMDDNIEIDYDILGLAKPKDINDITLDEFKNVLTNNKEIKGYYQSTLDTKVSKGINTFKEKTLPSLIEEGIKAKSEEGLTDEQKQLRALQAKIDQMEQEKAHNELLNSNRNKLKEAKLSEDLAKYIQSDEDIDFFKTLITNSINEGVKEKINNSNYTPPQSDNNIGFADGVEQQFFNKTGLKL